MKQAHDNLINEVLSLDINRKIFQCFIHDFQKLLQKLLTDDNNLLQWNFLKIIELHDAGADPKMD